MKRFSFLLYGVVSYLIFFGTFLYAIGFVGNLIVPKTIDGLAEKPFWTALLTDATLLLIFALQHSIMARPAFKKWWTRIVPEELERSTYVLLASLCLLLMMWQWQPLGGTVWKVDNAFVSTLLHISYFAGWSIVLISTFLINHFELFGLQQAWFHTRGHAEPPAPELREPSLYRVVRHPMMAGFFLAFWGTPQMTAGHLLLAIGMSAYILIALHYEERDLVSLFGADYEDYRRRVGMLIPRFRSSGGRSKIRT